jgi:hypothetical protein
MNEHESLNHSKWTANTTAAVEGLTKAKEK